MTELSLFTAPIEGSIKQEKVDSVVDAMCSFADTDCDFNGETGYIWDEAKAEDYESNLDYTADICRKESTPKKALFKFADMWLGRDTYYDNYKVEYTTKNNDFDDEINITSIAVAFCVNC